MLVFPKQRNYVTNSEVYLGKAIKTQFNEVLSAE